jgi:tRNA G10  N-methylase Trm11/alkylated DNA repair dioxygenase AlkB
VYHDPNFLPLEESEKYYEELVRIIPWKKTAKINRWVHLCQSDETTTAAAAASRPRVSDEDDQATDVVDGGNVKKPKSSSIRYSYRDNPDASSSEAAGADATVDIPPFPEPVERIRRACQEWYQQRRSMIQKAQDMSENPSADGDGAGGDDDVGSCPPPPSFNVCLLNFYEDGNQRIGWHSDREELGRTTPICSVSLGTTRQFQIRSKEQWDDQATIYLDAGSLVVMENLCQQQYLHAVPRETNVTDGRINLTFRCKNDEEDETTAGEELHRQRDNFMDQIAEETSPTTEAWSYHQKSDNGGSCTGLSLRATGPIFGDDLQLSLSSKDILEPSSVAYVIKTNLGAERYCAAELEENIKTHGWEKLWHFVIRPFDIDGYVALCRKTDEVKSNKEFDDDSREILKRTESMLLKMQSIHNVLRYHAHFRLQDCVADVERESVEFKEEMIPKEALYEHVKTLLVDKKMKVHVIEEASGSGGTFRVSCERIGGPHAWQAPDVEYEIGGAVAEFYEDRKWKPRMENYDVQIRADVVGRHVVIGTQLNISDLSKGRHFLQYRNSVTLKANLAFIMIRLANLKPGGRLLDPFCGSGTLVLEAQHIFGGKLHCIGMDVSRRSAEGAAANANAEGFGPDRCRFVCSDARGLRRHVDSGDDSVDAIASNLPWGVMTGQNQSTSDLQTLYEVFLRSSWYVLKPHGRIVMLVLRGLQVVRTVQKLSGKYRLVHVNVIRTTNNLPSIIVVEKLPIDEVREALKGQLSHLNQFVSVSPEIYRSIHTEDVWDDNDERERMERRK